MKYFISILVVLLGFSAIADVGDKYTIFAKSNRISFDSMLLEFTNVTVLADHDENPATAPVAVKAPVDLAASTVTDESFDLLGRSRDLKLTVGLVYDPTTVVKTEQCLGKDFMYVDPVGNFPSGKTCYKFTAKDFVIK